jgi:adenylate cyclase
MLSGRAKDGIPALQTGIRLDPQSPRLAEQFTWIEMGHYFSRQYEAAIAAAEQVIRSYPDYPPPYRWLAAALGKLGRIAEARLALGRAVAIGPAVFEMYVNQCPPWFRPEDHAHMLEGLRKAGWRERPKAQQGRGQHEERVPRL